MLLIVTVALEVLVTAIPALVLLAISGAVWRLRRRRTPHHTRRRQPTRWLV